MKALTKLALAAVLLATATAARADWVSGYSRSSGTCVAPHYRSPANGTSYDNLSYRGYPWQQPYFRICKVRNWSSSGRVRAARAK